jgi:hypothetical protein
VHTKRSGEGPPLLGTHLLFPPNSGGATGRSKARDDWGGVILFRSWAAGRATDAPPKRIPEALLGLSPQAGEADGREGGCDGGVEQVAKGVLSRMVVIPVATASREGVPSVVAMALVTVDQRAIVLDECKAQF